MSTTALFCLMAVLLLDTIWSITVSAKKFRNTLPLIVIIFVLLLFGSSYISIIQDELIRETVDQTGSLDYSSALLRYVITPKSLFGNGNLVGGIDQILNGAANIGLVTCFLDFCFYCILIVLAFKLVFSDSAQYHFMGLGCMYMLLHSLKLSIGVLSNPYLILIMVVLATLNQSMKVRTNISNPIDLCKRVYNNEQDSIDRRL